MYKDHNKTFLTWPQVSPKSLERIFFFFCRIPLSCPTGLDLTAAQVGFELVIFLPWSLITGLCHCTCVGGAVLILVFPDGKKKAV